MQSTLKRFVTFKIWKICFIAEVRLCIDFVKTQCFSPVKYSLVLLACERTGKHTLVQTAWRRPELAH